MRGSKKLILQLGAAFATVAGGFGSVGFAQSYTVTDLGTLGGAESFAFGINDRGQVVGHAETLDGSIHAFRWESGDLLDLGTHGGQNSRAYGINEAGSVVGWAQIGSGLAKAFLWSDGVMLNVGTLGQPHSVAYAINDSDEVVGWSGTWQGEIPGDAKQAENGRAFLWSDNSMMDIGSLGGGQIAAFDINASGQVVGWSTTPSLGPFHAFLWENGFMTDLGTLGEGQSKAYGINDAGQVVGWANGQGSLCFLWEAGEMVSLGSPQGWSEGSEISEAGLVVGNFGGPGAFLWRDGNMFRLNDLIPADSGWQLMGAFDINRFGQIVGVGFHHDVLRAFLLTPSTLPRCLAGNVNAGAGPTQDVLFVNGSAGIGDLREVRVSPADRFTVRVENPISRGTSLTRLALYAWIGSPSLSTVRPLPFDLGESCMPTPLTENGPPNPVHVWNTIGLTRLLGEPTLPSDRAPTTVLDLRRGVRRIGTFTLQGFILDSAAPNGQAAVTNGLVVVSQ